MLQVRNAVKTFGANKALDNVSLELREGEWLGLLGPNGAGKTTLIRTISGRVRLDSGSISLPGDKNQILGIVPQEIAVYPRLSAEENLRCFGELMGLTDRTLDERVEWALDFTGLQDRATDLVQTFSGGMRRRLNIACSVLHRPSVVLLDEPTVGVDPQSRQRIWEMLELLRKDGASLLLTTHQLDEAQQVCDRIVVIDHGRVVASGNFDELVRQTIGNERRVSITLESETQAAAFSAWPETKIEGNTVRAVLRDIASDFSGLLSHAVNSGLQVKDVHVQSPTLQAVFIHLTGRELRD
jgi:linearmycin/streptolysin S transport system ATP-binding protein